MMTEREPSLPESSDPCIGCIERQVCSAGRFLDIAPHLSIRPVCVHPCDYDETREYVESLRAENERLREALQNAYIPCVHRLQNQANADCREVGCEPCANCNARKVAANVGV